MVAFDILVSDAGLDVAMLVERIGRGLPLRVIAQDPPEAARSFAERVERELSSARGFVARAFVPVAGMAAEDWMSRVDLLRRIASHMPADGARIVLLPVGAESELPARALADAVVADLVGIDIAIEPATA